MASITDQQKAAIKTLTRRANRRLERATAGQRAALEYYINNYVGATKFSAATKGLTFQQAALKIKQLEQFLSAKSTTRKGWDEIKRENVRKANETLGQQGYDLTDDELAEILEQIDSSNRGEFYKAVNLVSAAKAEDEDWEGSSDDIANAIAEKATAQQALEKALKNREAIASRNKVAAARRAHQKRTGRK